MVTSRMMYKIVPYATSQKKETFYQVHMSHKSSKDFSSKLNIQAIISMMCLLSNFVTPQTCLMLVKWFVVFFWTILHEKPLFVVIIIGDLWIGMRILVTNLMFLINIKGNYSWVVYKYAQEYSNTCRPQLYHLLWIDRKFGMLKKSHDQRSFHYKTT